MIPHNCFPRAEKARGSRWDRIRRNRVSLGKNRGSSKATTRNPTLCLRTWPRLSPSGVACQPPSGWGSSPSLEPRDGEAGLGHERSGTARRCDRQSSPPAAGLDLGAGPSSPGENAFPGLSCGFQHFRCPGKSSKTNSLTENKACPTVVPRRGGGAFFKTLFEERTSESAQRPPPARLRKNRQTCVRLLSASNPGRCLPD